VTAGAAAGPPSDGRSATSDVVVIARPDDEVAADFVDDLRQSDLDVSLVETDDAERVIAAATEAARAGVRYVASVGGDGSINLVAQGLLSAEGSGDTTLAPVPNGTVNLVNHVLDLDTPGDTAQAVRDAAIRTLDVGRTEEGVFVLNASSGYDAAVIADGADHSDSPLGRVRFLLEGARRLKRDAPGRVRVDCDGERLFDGRAMSVIVMNFGQRGGERFDVAPDAQPDDGVLDVAVVRTGSLWRSVAVLARLALGRHVDPQDVLRAQASDVDVEWGRSVVTQRDGDADAEARRVSYAIAPGALRIVHR
jgi:diacylglycerol kinase (ATP)